MASMQEEMEDSRSSAVGRKRNLEDLQDQESAISRHSSPDDDVQRSSKRVKSQAELLEDALPPSAASLPNEILPIPHAVVPQPRPAAWNKGVQSGLRTSFGSRIKVSSKSAVPSPQDEVSPLPLNPTPDPANLLETNTSTLAEEAEADYVPMAITANISYHELSPHVRSYLEEPSLPQVDMAMSSAEEEGEIPSSRGTGHDADPLPPQTTTTLGKYGGQQALLSTGVVKDAASLQAHRHRHDNGDDEQPQGNAFIADLQPRKRIASHLSSTPSEAEEVVLDISSTLQSSSTTFKLLTEAEESQLSAPERATYLRLKKNQPKEQKQQSDLSRLESFERLTAEAEAIFEHEIPPLPKKYDSVTEKLSAGLSFFPRKVNKTPMYNKSNIDYRLPEIFDHGKPLRIQHLSFDIFAPAFLKENPSGWDSVILKTLISAFNAYRSAFYSIQALELAGSPKLSLSAHQMVNAISLKEAKRQAGLLILKDRSISMNDAPESQGAPENQGEIIPNERRDIDINNADVNPLDRELQQKYFPAAVDHRASYRCLACGDKYHMMIDCPSLTCVSCGGNHASTSCPLIQRCVKCRNLGHRAMDCPEKLALSKSEAVPCDLCGSIDHLERACHFIWRTFRPAAEEIRKVRDIALHCYICGGSGHYGPECGLYNRTRIYSGGGTWTKANLLKYIDASSVDRALSAGIDYSMGNQPKKGFSIKGKANNPIELDASDDDELIPEKVKKPKQNGQIRIAGIARWSQPSQDDDYVRVPNPPRQARPGLGRFSERTQPPAVDAVRYGRERAFSPPPRLDDMRYGFPSADNHFHPKAPQQRENSYRPRPQQAQSNYQQPPQGSLPMRPSPLAPSSGPRNGQAGRGGRGGGNNARGGGEKRKKKGKGANRGGGAKG